jgi:hypothetical protein
MELQTSIKDRFDVLKDHQYMILFETKSLSDLMERTLFGFIKVINY